jgi:hypothetical protein
VATPKAVRAAVATLIRDQDNAARHPFTFETACIMPGDCVPVTNLIPNQEYVIQNVSVKVVGGGFTSVDFEAFCHTANSTAAFLYANIPVIGWAAQSFSPTAYCDSSGAIFIAMSFVGADGNFSVANPVINQATVDISGYYVTLP